MTLVALACVSVHVAALVQEPVPSAPTVADHAKVGEWVQLAVSVSGVPTAYIVGGAETNVHAGGAERPPQESVDVSASHEAFAQPMTVAVSWGATMPLHESVIVPGFHAAFAQPVSVTVSARATSAENGATVPAAIKSNNASGALRMLHCLHMPDLHFTNVPWQGRKIGAVRARVSTYRSVVG